jgi:hypothetical protein
MGLHRLYSDSWHFLPPICGFDFSNIGFLNAYLNKDGSIILFGRRGKHMEWPFHGYHFVVSLEHGK